MLYSIKESVRTWNWRSQSIWEWDDKMMIPVLIDRLERWFYKTKEVTIDLQLFNLRSDSFTCTNLFEFLTHYKLVEDANLKYPVIVNREWQIIDWRHRVCKAIMKWNKSIKWIMILDASII